MPRSGERARPTGSVPARLVAAVCLGTLLNPLNSSMIAVALLRLRDDFGVTVTTVSWLISAFYLAAAVCQPLAGRIADQFGARRVFCLGLVLVCLTGALAPLSPSFGWLVGFRVVQAVGTSVAFPCGLVLIRTASEVARAGDRADHVDGAGQSGRAAAPTVALGALSVAASVSAAFGPVLGGFLVSLAGWPAVFVANVPVTLAGLAAALAWLPADRPHCTDRTARLHRLGRSGRLPGLVRSNTAPARVDLVGVLLFASGLAGLLGFLLSVPAGPFWPLLPVGPVALGLLVWWERRVAEPFLDVRVLASNRALLGVYLRFAAVNVAFYGAFYALPLWFEGERGLPPRLAGLLLLPLAGLGLLATPVAVRMIARRGPAPAMVFGVGTMLVGALLMLAFRPTSPIWSLVLVCAVLGLPNGFCNLSLQSSLFDVTPPEGTGTAAGLYQTSRYLGAILSTSLLGVVFAHSVGTAGLHTVAAVMAVISAALLLSSGTIHSSRSR